MSDAESSIAAGIEAVDRSADSPGTVRRLHLSDAELWLENQPKVTWREIFSIIAIVVLFDQTVYRGFGYTGSALFAAVAMLLLAVGAPQVHHRRAALIIGLVVILTAIRMVWSGNWMLMVAAVAWMVAFAMAVAGRRPYLLDVFTYAAHAPLAGLASSQFYFRVARRFSRPRGKFTGLLSIGLPIFVGLCFTTIFVLANPDVVEVVSSRLNALSMWISDLLTTFPGLDEFLIWLCVALITIGLMRPMLNEPGPEAVGMAVPHGADPAAISSLYAAFRNTLLAVIALFAVYLVFEFQTLWFREFPEGFYYGGYAHEGATWLTVALALSTAVLSAMFATSVVLDPRIGALRRLAWIWSIENLVLALSVYNRLNIYVDFNGMTRMRMVGIFGTTAVVVGFVLVLWKILHSRSLSWLVQRQLWTVAIIAFVYLMLPVDMIVHRYNVQRVLKGDLAPSVQIAVHPIDTPGYMVLHPLLDADDPAIREGVRAMLAERAQGLAALARNRDDQGSQRWTSYQLADVQLAQQLETLRTKWEMYRDKEARDRALATFRRYSFQWY